MHECNQVIGNDLKQEQEAVKQGGRPGLMRLPTAADSRGEVIGVSAFTAEAAAAAYSQVLL